MRREGRERALLAWLTGFAVGMRKKMPPLDQWLKPYEDPTAPKPRMDWRAVKAGFADLAAYQQADKARREKRKAAKSAAPVVVKPRRRKP